MNVLSGQVLSDIDLLTFSIYHLNVSYSAKAITPSKSSSSTRKTTGSPSVVSRCMNSLPNLFVKRRCWAISPCGFHLLRISMHFDLISTAPNTQSSVPTASSRLPELSLEISEPSAIFCPSACEINTSDVGFCCAATIVNHLAVRYHI